MFSGNWFWVITGYLNFGASSIMQPSCMTSGNNVGFIVMEESISVSIALAVRLKNPLIWVLMTQISSVRLIIYREIQFF